VHVRHEAAAVHMADAWGRLTGTAGIAMVTGGPGHANAVGALFTALGAESPMVPLSGALLARLEESQIQLISGTTAATASMDASSCRRDTTRSWLGGHGELVDRAADLPAALERALASGKPACVNVMIESIAAPAIRLPQ
jgi:thiamine pyrophosphate-dependent acetolactate synthase large subunit-like protein